MAPGPSAGDFLGRIVSAPRVSVLMPVHNSGRFVEQACQSILRQTFRELELVVVDDGSTDDSLKHLRALAERDSRMVIVVREKRGLIASRNELLALSRAPLLAWMDSDDWALPQRLAHQVARFELEDSLVCLGGAVMEVDPDGQPIGRVSYPTEHEAIERGMRLGGAMRFPTTMMRRQVVIDLGGFREPFKMGEDLDLFFRLMEVGGVANLSEVLLHYRMHPHNTSRILASRWGVYRDAIVALAKERAETGADRLQRGETLVLSFPPEIPIEVRAWDSHRDWARQALAAGYLRAAWKHALKALSLAPLRFPSWRLAARVFLETSLRRHPAEGVYRAEKSS